MNYWFLYNLTDGSIFGGPHGDLSGTLTQWSNVPSDCGVIGPIAGTDTTAQDAFVNPHYYSVVNGKLTQVSNVSSLQLADAKTKQMTSLQQSCNNALATFQSNALGTTKTYLCDRDSMVLLAGEFGFITSSYYDNSAINWYTVEDGKEVPHTVAQFAQVYKDGRNWVASCKAKLENLTAQVNSATTISAVQAVTW